MATEQEIRLAIEEAAKEQKEARAQVAYHKRAAIDAESRLISANLHRERLQEELRVHLNTTPQYEEDPRDREIEELKAKMPELLKKV